jgi:hypothetical protein
MPFAQSEMIHTLLMGVSPKYTNALYGAFIGSIDPLSETIVDSIDNLTKVQKKALKTTLKKLIIDGYSNTIENINAHSAEVHYKPIIDAIEFLPIDELAIVAETCVNLNSFQKKVSMEDETVGGPVDVLVISKGDGLIWIKRKHYFDPKLNRHFFKNYFD